MKKLLIALALFLPTVAFAATTTIPWFTTDNAYIQPNLLPNKPYVNIELPALGTTTQSTFSGENDYPFPFIGPTGQVQTDSSGCSPVNHPQSQGLFGDVVINPCDANPGSGIPSLEVLNNQDISQPTGVGIGYPVETMTTYRQCTGNPTNSNGFSTTDYNNIGANLGCPNYIGDQGATLYGLFGRGATSSAGLNIEGAISLFANGTSSTNLGGQWRIYADSGLSATSPINSGLAGAMPTMVIGGGGVNNNYVGIGTTTPFAELSIAPAQQSNSPLFDVSSTTGKDLFQIDDLGRAMFGTTSAMGFTGTSSATLSIVGTTTILNGPLLFGNKSNATTNSNYNIVIVNGNDPIGINRNTLTTGNARTGDTIVQTGETASIYCAGFKTTCIGYGNQATTSTSGGNTVIGSLNSIKNKINNTVIGSNNLISQGSTNTYIGINNADTNDVGNGGFATIIGSNNLPAANDNIFGNSNVSDYELDGFGGNNFIFGSNNQAYSGDFQFGSQDIDNGTLGGNLSLGNLSETNGTNNVFIGNNIDNSNSGNVITSNQVIIANSANPGDGNSLQDDVSGDLAIGNNGHGYLYVNRDGLMGVGGTTTPYALLSVATSSPQAGLTLFDIASSTKAELFGIDGAGHRFTGGSSPTCGTGCASVKGDDSTMRVVTNSAVTSITVNFSTKYPESPVCIPTEEDGGLSGAVDASTTPSTVTLTTSASVTSINIGIMCQQSNNFTY